jgi:hypothetical protein
MYMAETPVKICDFAWEAMGGYQAIMNSDHILKFNLK